MLAKLSGLLQSRAETWDRFLFLLISSSLSRGSGSDDNFPCEVRSLAFNFFSSSSQSFYFDIFVAEKPLYVNAHKSVNFKAKNF